MIDQPLPKRDERILDGLCARARAAGEPAETDVARLRRSVRGALAAERATARRPAILRPLALAASLALAVLALASLRPGPASLEAGGADALAAVPVPVKTASGKVAFRLPEGRTVRVIRTTSPRAEQGVAETARGLYVDREDGAQAPGTVVFYRFD
ncbi:MAG: hypothetical protein Kow0062_26940 [Acidobacteriota bacterium]